MTRYIIVTAMDVPDLIRGVNLKIQQGWQVVGGMSVDSAGRYMQAMTKDE